MNLDFPSLGDPDLQYVVKDENGFVWEGREQKTVDLASTNIEVSLAKLSTGQVLAKMNVVNENGQWKIVYPQD